MNKNDLLIKLMIACSDGNIDEVKKYIKLGVDINSLNNGLSPLKYSVDHEQFEIVKLLLDSGADATDSLSIIVNSASDYFHNGFEDLTNYVKITKLLLDYGADITYLESSYPFQQEVIIKIKDQLKK